MCPPGCAGPRLFCREPCRTRVLARPRPASLCVRADNGPAAGLSSRPGSPPPPPPPPRAAGFLGSREGKAALPHRPALLPRRRPTAPGNPWQMQTCKFAGRSQLGAGLRARGGRGGGGGGGRGAHRLRAGRVAATALRRVRARRGPPAAPPPTPPPRCRPGRSGSRARGGGAGGGCARGARAGTSSLHCWATFATTRRAAASARRRRRCRRRLPAARAPGGPRRGPPRCRPAAPPPAGHELVADMDTKHFLPLGECWPRRRGRGRGPGLAGRGRVRSARWGSGRAHWPRAVAVPRVSAPGPGRRVGTGQLFPGPGARRERARTPGL